MLLRVAGQYAIKQGEERLKASHLVQAKAILDNKVALHRTAKPRPVIDTRLASASDQALSISKNFTNVAASAGILFEHRTSDWLNRLLRSYIKKDENTGIITVPPAFGGSGVAAEDINNDGYVDLLLLGGRGNKLFINQGDGSFKGLTTEYGLNWARAQDKPIRFLKT